MKSLPVWGSDFISIVICCLQSQSEDEEDFILDYKVELFLQMNRYSFLSYPHRIKTFFRPQLVTVPGIHFPKTWLPVPGLYTVRVDSDVAFLAHHRPPSDHESRREEIGPRTFEIRVLSFYRNFLGALRQAHFDFLNKYHI